MRGAPFALALTLLGGLLAHGTCQAQDRVTYTPPGASRPLTVIGAVVDSTGRELTLRPASGATQRIDPESIVEIQTVYEPSHLKGIELFAQGDVAAARSALHEALEREHRDWVDREILAWLVKCDLREQNLAGALESFRSLVKTDPLTRHWGQAPLAWAPATVSDQVRSEMRRWLKSTSPPERLLAASLLLLDPVSGEAADKELDTLARDPNPIVSAYSRAQLWRLDIARRNVSELALEDWRTQIDRLKPVLRAGPQYLLARGYEVRGELRRAAAEALWIPFVCHEPEALAARALLDAAESLQRTGLAEEAGVLQRELLARYPWSGEAAQVRSRARQQPGT